MFFKQFVHPFRNHIAHTQWHKQVFFLFGTCGMTWIIHLNSRFYK